jgi:hypothetical protein
VTDKPWTEITFIGFDNSKPPQLWAWKGPNDETAEPLFRVSEADLVERCTHLTAERDEANNRIECYEAMKEGVAIRIADIEKSRDDAREAARTILGCVLAYVGTVPSDDLVGWLDRWPWLAETNTEEETR